MSLPVDLSLARATGVFALLTVAAWGVGDALASALQLSRPGESRLTRPILSLAIGFGILGEALFIAGVVGDAYRPTLVGPAIALLAGFALFRVPGRVSMPRFPRIPDRGWTIWTALALVTFYAVQWAWVSVGFNPGSDVFSHHYIDVKAMIRARHFTYAVHLPSLLAHVSSYNPALARMLWLPGHLLADERAANMVHGLTQFMMVGGIYVVGRNLRSTRAGLYAVCCYLTAGMMGYYPLEAQDYTLMAVFMILAVDLLASGVVSGARREFIGAGLLAGLMLGTKYYALPIAVLFALAILFWHPPTWQKRVGHMLTFSAVALAVYAPWVLYNVRSFGDPLFPMSLRNGEMDVFRATYWIHTLSPFVVPSDHGFVWPTAFYYLSLFLPFDPGSAAFGLSIVFLAMLPASVYWLARSRGESWRPAHVLFVLSVASFAALHVLVGHSAFYKWAFFPAVLYACSLGISVDQLRPRVRHALWILTLTVACLNYWFIVLPRTRAIVPPVEAQQARWPETTRYLNATLEPGSVISGMTAVAAYYLRPDLLGLVEDDMTPIDWIAEEGALRRAGVTHMLVSAATDAANDALLRRWRDLWRQLAGPDVPQSGFILDVERRTNERHRERDAFLVAHGALLHTFSDGTCLYRISGE